jgi:hypothetical protein
MSREWFQRKSEEMIMGGSGGVIIVHTAAVQALTDPTVHGGLPINTQLLIDPILGKDLSTWTHRDKKDVAAAFTWALCNLK